MDRYILLWGKHEAILNNILSRFEEHEITNLFTFFDQDRFNIIFHDKFHKLQRANQELLLGDKEKNTFVETIKEQIVDKYW